MKLSKIIKLLVLVVAITIGFHGSHLLACSAMATSCGNDCQIDAPPGGTAQCTDAPHIATCIAYDKNGNVVGYSTARCPLDC